MADDPNDVNTLPQEVDVDGIVSQAVGERASTVTMQDDATGEGVQQMIPFPFCLRFNSQPWQTIIVAAPSPDLAADTVGLIVQRINEVLSRMGYPPNMCTASAGSC